MRNNSYIITQTGKKWCFKNDNWIGIYSLSENIEKQLKPSPWLLSFWLFDETEILDMTWKITYGKIKVQ